MLCPKGHNVARLVIKLGGEVLCPVCDGISEISHSGPYQSPRTKQRLDWQREKFASDLEQPFEVRKGEVTKGWQPNKRYIKTYKSDPKKMGMYSEKDLKSSGLVSEKEISKIIKSKPSTNQAAS